MGKPSLPPPRGNLGRVQEWPGPIPYWNPSKSLYCVSADPLTGNRTRVKQSSPKDTHTCAQTPPLLQLPTQSERARARVGGSTRCHKSSSASTTSPGAVATGWRETPRPGPRTRKGEACCSAASDLRATTSATQRKSQPAVTCTQRLYARPEVARGSCGRQRDRKAARPHPASTYTYTMFPRTPLSRAESQSFHQQCPRTSLTTHRPRNPPSSPTRRRRRRPLESLRLRHRHSPTLSQRPVAPIPLRAC